jgi:uncharacterized lipoprotein YajG
MQHDERAGTTRTLGSIALSVLIALMFFAGCAEKGPILLTVGYQAPAGMAGTSSAVVAEVSPFRDVRGVQPSVLGRRIIPSGMQNDLVVQGTVAQMATKGLKEALVRRGVAVKDVADWDLTAEGIPTDNAGLVLGGEINVLWLESTASTFDTHLKASVQLKVVAGDTVSQKIIRTINVNSKLDEDVLYSRQRLESTLSEALSSAIDQIFADEELKKRFQ